MAPAAMHRTEQDAQLEARALEVEVVVGAVQMQLNLWMLAGEFGQARRQPRQRQVEIGLQRQRVFLVLAEQRGRGFFDGTQRTIDHRQEGVARVGQLDVACTALEQCLAEVRFQRLDLLADRRGAHVQMLGGARKVFHARGGFEYPQPVQRWNAASHCIFPLQVKFYLTKAK